MLRMVWATAVLNSEMTNKPTTLQMAARMMAVWGLTERVPTRVATAFGAAEAPFTTVAPITMTMMITRMGLAKSI